MKQQYEAEEQTDTLKNNLEQTKDTMRGRPQAIEASLGEMLQQLTEEL